jgi:predicted PurR-regulated permease PerM
VVLLLGLSQLSRIVGPFFLALNLMIVVWPIQRFLSRRVPRVLAAILSGLLAIVIIGLLFWAIGWAASLFVQEIPQYKPQFQTMYDQALNLLAQFGVTSSQIVDQLKSINPGSVVSVVGSLLSNVGGAVSLFVVVITVLLFMVVDSVDFEGRLERLGQRHNPVLVLALNSFAQGVRKYWVTSTVFGLIVSTLTWVGLAAYGIPLAIVWAVLAFVTNYIPNIGFVIGLVPAAVMGLLAKGPWGAVFVIVLYGVLNFVIQGVVQPKVAGEAVGVTSTVSFLSLLVWAVVLGPLGALLALPATLFVKALVVDADPKARWLNALIASNPKTSSEEPVLVEEGVAPVDPPVAQAVPAEDADVLEDQPRHSLGEEPEAESVAHEAVVPRRSALEPDDEDLADEPAPAHLIEVPAFAHAPSAEALPPTDEAVPALDEASPLDEAEAPAVATDAAADGPRAHEEPGAAPDGPEDDPQTHEEPEATSDEPETDDLQTHHEPGAASDQPETDDLDSDDLPAHEEPAAAADEPEPEDVPRRARPDEDSRLSDDEDVPGDDWPVFQKSATPYWTGAVTHAED